MVQFVFRTKIETTLSQTNQAQLDDHFARHNTYADAEPTAGDKEYFKTTEVNR